MVKSAGKKRKKEVVDDKLGQKGVLEIKLRLGA